MYVTIVKLLYYDYQGATIYKQGESVFIGHLLKGCDAEQSGEYNISLCVCVCVCVFWYNILLVTHTAMSNDQTAPIFVTGPAIINHVSTKKSLIFSIFTLS